MLFLYKTLGFFNFYFFIVSVLKRQVMNAEYKTHTYFDKQSISDEDILKYIMTKEFEMEIPNLR